MTEQPSTPPTQTPTPEPAAMSLTERIRLYGGIAVGIVLVIFFFQNLHQVDIKFLWMEWETNLFWALLLSAIVGALIALAIGTIRGRAARRQARVAARDVGTDL